VATQNYKNKTIKTESNNHILYIDNTKIDCNFDIDAKKYFAYAILPYQQFSTLEDLAKSIIDSEENS